MQRNGSFWYGPYGFLYKKAGPAGGRKNPSYGLICNQPQYLYNKYHAGNSGIGGQSVATRRAKNRLASICRGDVGQQNCCYFYNYLGRYNRYLYNPNGFVPIPICNSNINYNIPNSNNT